MMADNSFSNLTTITITTETRRRLEVLCKKDQDFYSVINKLILLSSDKLEDFW